MSEQGPTRKDEIHGNLPLRIVKAKSYRSKEVEVMRKALRVAGSPEKLAEWVRTPIASLNGQTPYAAMQTAQGRREVDEVLTRIEHGVY
jgi:uncharacterized protein (DUF2384 family)